MLVLASSLAAYAGPTSRKVVDVEVVKRAIQAKHAKWRAAENWVSRKSVDEVKRMLGAQGVADATAEFTALGAEIQYRGPAIDWRNKDGQNWVSPILNQGNCGSCVAFATVATLETQVNISSGIPQLNPSFSKQALFACGGGGCEFGWMPELASKYLQKKGVPDEACAPYTMGSTGQDVSCSSICSDAASRSLKVVKFTTPTNGAKNIEAVKAALARGPLQTTLTVYQDFVTYAGGVYKNVGGEALGGHAVSIVGWSDSDRAWIIRNSWSPDWGENGFARVSWDDISGVGENTWQYQVPSPQGYISIRNPGERTFHSGIITMDVESTFPGTNSIDVKLTSRNRGSQNFNCGSSPCNIALDTTTLSDGLYDLVATAHWSGGSTNSQHSLFYVINHQPSVMNIAYSGVDLSKPLSDRPVWNLKIDSGSVPLTSIRFHVKNSSGELFTRSADMVLPQMTFGWRTMTVPNGRYEIYFTGELVTETQHFTVESAHATVTVKNRSGMMLSSR